MAQRNSGYDRKPRDLYETPEWVSEAIKPHIPDNAVTWEPACASGKMSRVINAWFYSDIETEYGLSGIDFLKAEKMPEAEGGLVCNAIITNPPFGKDAEKFIRHGLKLLAPNPEGFMAMLLPVDFDSAKTRRDIFMEAHGCINFMGKIVLTSRITWFEPAIASPSANHAWYLWAHWYDFPWIQYHYR